MSHIKTSENKLIVFRDECRIFFNDFPDFPIFESSFLPDAAWKEMEIDFDQLIDDLTESDEKLEKLHSLLKEEFQSLNSPDERSEYLRRGKSEIDQILDRFEELTDPSLATEKGKDDDINQEAYHLHCIIKYDLDSFSPLGDFMDLIHGMLMNAILTQGYLVDTYIGEITKVPTAKCVRETPL
jgi:hypothetical protein